MTAPPPHSQPDSREAIARIIHPIGFEEDSMERINVVEAYRKEAFKKADAILALLPPNFGVQCASANLTKIAAECHRSKWQFDDTGEKLMPAAEARRLVRKAFDELHRIGDMVMKMRDDAKASSLSSAHSRSEAGK